ncbi:MAG: 3-phosphoshikimate 1-carboxyvinyltransferase [Acidobacteria bacterium]|nr:3-phosphoshikimate 1-carboxyvinyltransferase [Acidobacteriota bacterium]
MSVAAPTSVIVEPARRLRGRLRVPGDKSISHRYALLAALAGGTSTIDGYSTGADCGSTLRCLRELGVEIAKTAKNDGTSAVTVAGRGLGGLSRPARMLDAGNSGTTMRLLAGILAGHPFDAVLTGDASLQRRPMRRIIEPLERMGGRVEADGGRPPLRIRGGSLNGTTYVPAVASAQVKSAVLLAGLHARGVTRVREPAPTRDHTERALEAFGVPIDTGDGAVAVAGGSPLRPLALMVPGDPSSAAFWAVAAAAVPDSDVTIEGVGLNPTRTAFLDVLSRAGAAIEVHVEDNSGGEPSGEIRIRSGSLRNLVIGAAEVPSLIDELPVLGALAAHGPAVEVGGASELRHKESDRITALAAGLRAIGVRVEERPDGFRAERAGVPQGGAADAAGDHRLAMAFAVAGLAGAGPSVIHGAGATDVSYPGFFSALDSLHA